VTSKTTQLAENLTLEEFGSDEAQLARELAGRIQQLHNTNKESPRTTGPEQTKPTKPVAQRMTFNPLHPSMELPPEQLIRLMAMHSQQLAIEARKHKPGKEKSAVTDIRPNKPAAPGLLELEYSDEYETPRPYKRLAAAMLVLVCISAYFVLKNLPKKPAPIATTEPVIEQLPLAPVQEQATPKPVTKNKLNKVGSGKKALEADTLPISVIPVEVPPTTNLSAGFPEDEIAAIDSPETSETTLMDISDIDATNIIDIETTELPGTEIHEDASLEADL
jgi:hypothetical protein